MEDGQSALDFLVGEGRFAGRDIRKQLTCVFFYSKTPIWVRS